jgi:hypothetical protein
MVVSIAAGIAGALTVGWRPPAALANAVTGQTIVVAADQDFGIPNGMGGGELRVTALTGPLVVAPLGPGVQHTPALWQTFCLEKHEDLHDAPFDWVLSAAAKWGGGSAASGALFDGTDWFDPICDETAWIFRHFWTGDLAWHRDSAGNPLVHYDYANAGGGRPFHAGSVQQAIWILENEVPETPYTTDPDVRGLLAEARLAVASGFVNDGGVKVLNITSHVNGSDELRQDVLVLAPGTRPDIRLTKTADPAFARPFQPVTYGYLVENVGNEDLANVIVTDDNGTPTDGSDDFQFGPVSISAGGSHSFTKTVIPAVLDFCATIGDVPDTRVGTLTTHVLPGGDVEVKYVQSETVANDNRYGTGATAATGWPKGHKFGALTGSDKCEFRFRDSNDNVVLDFYADYITGATSATFPSGTVNYPSKYGTLGCTGGDGSVVTGSAAHVLSVRTSLSDCLNLPQFQALNLVNSPPETSPMSGVSIPAGWDYENSYTVVVSAAAFGANGFGSVEIPGLHDSPPKTGRSNLITPEPCDTTVTNTAIATATVVGSGLTVTASASASVLVGDGVPDVETPSVTATITKIDKRKLTIALTNDGTAAATIGALDFDWPAGNKKLRHIEQGGSMLFDKKTAPTTVTVSTWKGSLADRQIPAGGTLTLTFEFEATANTTAAAYHMAIDFGGGFVDLLP